jgi:hypothetical protein
MQRAPNYKNISSKKIENELIEDEKAAKELYELLKNVYARKHSFSQPCMCFRVEGTFYHIKIEYNDGTSDQIYVSDMNLDIIK